MKNPLAATVLLTFALGVRATYLPALTNGQTKVARVPMKQIAGEEVVQVSINGTGPYNFILDTGSNVTIIRSELIRKLNLSGGSPCTDRHSNGGDEWSADDHRKHGRCGSCC